MWIYTADGWKMLVPQNVIPAAPDSRYRGELPSPQILAFIASMEADIKQMQARHSS